MRERSGEGCSRLPQGKNRKHPRHQSHRKIALLPSGAQYYSTVLFSRLARAGTVLADRALPRVFPGHAQNCNKQELQHCGSPPFNTHPTPVTTQEVIRAHHAPNGRCVIPRELVHTCVPCRNMEDKPLKAHKSHQCQCNILFCNRKKLSSPCLLKNVFRFTFRATCRIFAGGMDELFILGN